MKFNEDIVALAMENDYFRKVVTTGENSQVVLMNIPPGEDIGEEVHEVDQVLFFVDGEGEAVIEGEVSPVAENYLTFVPAGSTHNFRNTGQTDLKLFTIYSPPQHTDGTIHETKEEAEMEE